MPEGHRKFDRLEMASAVVLGMGLGACATVLTIYESSANSGVDETACTAVPSIPEDIPDEDTNEITILNRLHISRDQLSLVKGYAATCHTPLSPEQFQQGITTDPTTYNEYFNTSYDRCATYWVPTQLIPPIGDETTPALLVCIDLPGPPNNELKQI